MMQARLSQIGLENGIKFSYGGKTGNTRNSHRLIALAKSKSPALQTRTVEELFKLYFENEGDITDVAKLQEAGVKAGLEEGEVKKWLASDDGGKEVDREVREAQIRGISGVPNFTVDGKYEIGGAQDESVFLQLFEKIQKAEQVRSQAVGGESC
jgi:predicted DsbA family dithiol-disulfide isomerase